MDFKTNLQNVVYITETNGSTTPVLNLNNTPNTMITVRKQTYNHEASGTSNTAHSLIVYKDAEVDQNDSVCQWKQPIEKHSIPKKCNPTLTPETFTPATHTPSTLTPHDSYPPIYPRDSYPPDIYPRDSYPPDIYPRDSYPPDIYPRDSYPRDS